MSETVTWLTVPSWVRSAHCICRNPVYQPVAASHEPLCPRGEALRDWQSLRGCRARLAALVAAGTRLATEVESQTPAAQFEREIAEWDRAERPARAYLAAHPAKGGQDASV